VPNNLPAKPPKKSLLPLPSPEAENARRENLSRFITLAVLQFCIVIFLTAIAGPGVGFFIGALLMAGFIVTLNNSGKNSKVDLEVRLEKARQDWNQLETEWSGADVLPQFNSDVALIRQKINEHHRLQQQSREKVKLLHDDVFRYKLDVYLSSFKIGDAKIADQARNNLEALKSFGIRSAADIDARRLKSLPPAFKETLEELHKWRKELERAFVYKPDAEIPESEQKRLTEGFAEKRGNIEREIENLLVSLRSGSTLVRQRQQFLTARADTVARQLLQSESDLAATGSITPPIVVLILITTLIPMFGNALSASRPYRSVLRDEEPKRRAPVVDPQIRPDFSTNYSDNTLANASSYKVPDKLTDQEIEGLTDLQKSVGAHQLLERASTLAADGNYKKAEQRLQLALKLEANSTLILNKLGEVLYAQKKYKDSLIYLNRALRIDPNNNDTKFSIGMNHLKMSYYEDARKIFTEVVNKDPRSFEGQFNLGQAYKGLNQYNSAVTAFRTATEIKPNDADAHYNYAICLNKVGSQDGVTGEYQKLYELNPKLAEKLRKELGLKNVPKPESKNTYSIGSGTGSGSGSGIGSSAAP
jgi:tetratricopeptide (TPR) repeat protein